MRLDYAHMSRTSAEIRRACRTPSSTSTGTSPSTSRRSLPTWSRRDSRSITRRCGACCPRICGPDHDWHAQSADERARHARRPWSVVELTCAEHHRPRDRAVPRAALRTARRSRPRLQRRVPEPRARVPPHLGRRRAAEARAARSTVATPRPSRPLPIASHPLPPSRCTRPTKRSPSSSTRSTCSDSSRCCVRATCNGRSTPRSAPTPSWRAGPTWLDQFGIDSAYDYDPVWAGRAGARRVDRVPLRLHRAQPAPVDVELRVQPPRMLAEGQHSLAKSLFLGGVTRRFPGMNFAFLEGGVAWAAALYSDLIGHWEKRNIAALRANLDPALVDRERDDRVDRTLRADCRRAERLRRPREPDDMLDEWAACGIERREDIKTLFVDPFYFGCEADDPLTSTAFNTKINPFGARPPRDDGLRHRSLGRPRHDRGARGGVGDGRSRLDRRTPTSRSSPSRIRCGSTRAPTPTSSREQWSKAPSPSSSRDPSDRSRAHATRPSSTGRARPRTSPTSGSTRDGSRCSRPTPSRHAK